MICTLGKKTGTIPEVDFEYWDLPEDEYDEIHYWRKHPNLHGWMHDLYVSKGGSSEHFNGDAVALTTKDLQRLRSAIKKEGLPYTTGSLFGTSRQDEHERRDDLDFIKRALDAIRDGYSVFYTSSW